MKLKMFTNAKIEQGFVLINKFGAIRFKKEFAMDMGFKHNERWIIGIDKEENPVKHLYVIRPDKENEHNGFKMSYQNKSWFITCRTLLKELSIEFPAKCRMEEYNDDKYSGFRILLPENGA